MRASHSGYNVHKFKKSGENDVYVPLMTVDKPITNVHKILSGYN